MGISQFAAGQRVRAQDLNQLPVVVSYLATGTVSGTASETVIGTFTIPAGDPTAPGGYWWKVHGVATSVSTPNITIRIRLNSVTGTILLGAGPSSFGVTPAIWQYDGWLGFEAIGSSGTFGFYCIVADNFTTPSVTATATAQQEAVAINTTVANTLVCTAQFSVSNASNTATSKFGAMYRL